MMLMTQNDSTVTMVGDAVFGGVVNHGPPLSRSRPEYETDSFFFGIQSGPDPASVGSSPAQSGR